MIKGFWDYRIGCLENFAISELGSFEVRDSINKFFLWYFLNFFFMYRIMQPKTGTLNQENKVPKNNWFISVFFYFH